MFRQVATVWEEAGCASGQLKLENGGEEDAEEEEEKKIPAEAKDIPPVFEADEWEDAGWSGGIGENAWGPLQDAPQQVEWGSQAKPLLLAPGPNVEPVQLIPE